MHDLSKKGKARSQVAAHCTSVVLTNCSADYSSARDALHAASIAAGSEKRGPQAYTKGTLTSFIAPTDLSAYREISYYPSVGVMYMVDDQTEWEGSDQVVLLNGKAYAKGHVRTGHLVDFPLKQAR